MSEIKTFYLNDYLKNLRRIQVYLPKNFNENNAYDVLYLHDGQNIFNPEFSHSGISWQVDKTLDEFYKNHSLSLIVVSIDNINENRLNEYSPFKSVDLSKIINWDIPKFQGGLGKQYADFIVDDLMPFINNKYKTANNYLAGSSMGGYISLYIGYKYSHLFTHIGAFSTALWFNKNEMFNFIKNNFNENLNVYLDVGKKETSDESNKNFSKIYLNDTLELANLLDDLNIKNKKLIIDEKGIHSELAWRKRFKYFLSWIYNI